MPLIAFTHKTSGLHLNHSERVVLLLLSYFFYGPLLWKTSAKFISTTVNTLAEARRALREENQLQGQQEEN